jgi:hypothetical protein
MRGHSGAEVFDPAGIDQDQIFKAEVLHSPGDRSHVSFVHGFYQDNTQLHHLPALLNFLDEIEYRALVFAFSILSEP